MGMQHSLRLASGRGKKISASLESEKDEVYTCRQSGDKTLDRFAKETFPDYAEIFSERLSKYSNKAIA